MKPILFNTEMVRAILGGRKTVTRRVVKPQPICHGPNLAFNTHDGDFFLSAEKHWLRCRVCGHDPQYSRESSNIAHHWEPPYSPGDVLYVRETWAKSKDGYYLYRAWTGPGNEPEKEDEAMKRLGLKWHPSIHMPKEAARIFLRVTDVRVERLQDMTMSDILAEGVVPEKITGGQWQQWQDDYMKPVWDTTIKPADMDKYGWDANPWCWVIEYDRISKEEAMKEELT